MEIAQVQKAANAPGGDHGHTQGGGQELDDAEAQDLGPADLGNWRGWGRARVEILAVRVDSGVAVNSITVFDGIQGQTIYKHEEHEDKGEVEPDEEGMVPLALTGPYTGISAYGNFAIEVDFQTGEGSMPITWEWDCYKPEYADQVDVLRPVPYTIISSSDPSRKVKVSYLVMSNALEATVQVMLRLKDDPEKDEYLPQEQDDDGDYLPPGKEVGDRYFARGKIRARIGGLEDQIVLFNCGPKGKASIPHSSILPLARSVVAVPYGKPLHIEVLDLHITDTSSNEVVIKQPEFNLSFDCGRLSSRPTNKVSDDEVEVNVTWYPEQEMIEIEPHGKVECIIRGDDGEEKFTSFIDELRDIILIANNPDHKDLLEDHPDPRFSSTCNHPVLAGPRDNKQPARWIHVKLQVVASEGTSSTTLAVRGDTLYGVGFMNQCGVWYDLGNPHGDKILPPQYHSVLLNWGVSYRSLLDVSDWKEVMDALRSIKHSKAFAMDAVRVLSRYPDVKDDDDLRLPLVGLMVMICESARLNPLKKYFVDIWDTKEFSPELMDYIRNWGAMSQTLLHWKDHDYRTWPQNLRAGSTKIKCPEDALEVVHLVLNSRHALAMPKQIEMDDKVNIIKDEVSAPSPEEEGHFNDDEPIISPPNSGPRPTPIVPGRVQLVSKNNNMAPLEENTQKVLLELSGGDSTSDRSGLDLVAVLDVSGSMQGKKIEKMKTAMKFVVKKLSSIDRLSIVTFGHTATRICPLLQVTDASQPELLGLIDDALRPGGSTNISDGLQTGLKVLTDRKLSSCRVVGVMLMSDGQQNRGGNAADVKIGNVPVYTFGFGADYDPTVLNAVARNSMGGTFSVVNDVDTLSMAFSQCLAGLLTVVVQDLTVTVARVEDESTIQKVAAGNYPQTQDADAGSVTVAFGDLYSKEVRKVIVDLLLPAIDTERGADILEVTYSYKTAGKLFDAPPATVTVRRSGSAFAEDDPPVDVMKEEARLQTATMIKQARTMADGKKLDDALDKLVEAQNALGDVPVAEPYEDPLLSALNTELKELLKLMKSQEVYEQQGRPYAMSSETSHDRQRFAARGDMEKNRLFATPRMDKYLEQAKKFDEDPAAPLPSADEDEKEEVAANPLAPLAGPITFYIQAAIQALQAIEKLISNGAKAV